MVRFRPWLWWRITSMVRWRHNVNHQYQSIYVPVGHRMIRDFLLLYEGSNKFSEILPTIVTDKKRTLLSFGHLRWGSSFSIQSSFFFENFCGNSSAVHIIVFRGFICVLPSILSNKLRIKLVFPDPPIPNNIIEFLFFPPSTFIGSVIPTSLSFIPSTSAFSVFRPAGFTSPPNDCNNDHGESGNCCANDCRAPTSILRDNRLRKHGQYYCRRNNMLHWYSPTVLRFKTYTLFENHIGNCFGRSIHDHNHEPVTFSGFPSATRPGCRT